MGRTFLHTNTHLAWLVCRTAPKYDCSVVAGAVAGAFAGAVAGAA